MPFLSDEVLKDWPAFVASVMGLLLLVGMGEGLRATGRFSAEATRRFVHVGVGLFVVACPLLFRRPDLVYLLAGAFVVFNLLTFRRGWLRGMHGVARPSLGTATFPLALLVALFFCWTLDADRLFALHTAFFILALSDPLAAVVGTWLKQPGRYRLGGDEKSAAGTVAFSVSALLLSLGALAWFAAGGRLAWSGGEVLLAALLVAGVTAAAEALASKGWDNFFIVVAALVVLVFFEEHPAARTWLAISLGVGVLFGGMAFWGRLLDASGAVAGGLLAASLLGLGGWAWAVPAFAFFFLSSALSKLGKRRKTEAERRSEKGSVRDAGQVYANGGVGWGLLLLYALDPAEGLYWGFLGAFAAAAADTWATEIGTLSKHLPRFILNGRKVPRGTSGAVSGLGTAGALLGAAAVFVSAWLVAGERLAGAGVFTAACVIMGSGLVASFVDSLAGATVQARYLDPDTDEETERPPSPNRRVGLVRGLPWVDNDFVNLLCTLTGAALALSGFLLL